MFLFFEIVCYVILCLDKLMVEVDGFLGVIVYVVVIMVMIVDDLFYDVVDYVVEGYVVLVGMFFFGIVFVYVFDGGSFGFELVFIDDYGKGSIVGVGVFYLCFE